MQNIEDQIDKMWDLATSPNRSPGSLTPPHSPTKMSIAQMKLAADAKPFIPSRGRSSTVPPSRQVTKMNRYRQSTGRSFADPSKPYAPLPRQRLGLPGYGSEGDVDSNSDSRQPRKVKLCRHFLNGHCRRGKDCDFLHDCSVFLPDDQKIFLGGIPPNTTAEVLVEEMRKAGYTVVNEPMIHPRGFAPKVCVENAAMADSLVEMGQIAILGKTVDIRRYKDKKGHNALARSICLTALPIGATEHDIRNVLEPLGFQVTRVIIQGCNAELVTLKTVDQADALLILEKLRINDKRVGIVPYGGRREHSAPPHSHNRRQNRTRAFTPHTLRALGGRVESVETRDEQLPTDSEMDVGKW